MGFFNRIFGSRVKSLGYKMDDRSIKGLLSESSFELEGLGSKVDEVMRKVKLHLGYFNSYLSIKGGGSKFKFGNLEMGVKGEVRDGGIVINFGLGGFDKDSAFNFNFDGFDRLSEKGKRDLCLELERGFCDILVGSIDEGKFYKSLRDFDNKLSSKIKYGGK